MIEIELKAFIDVLKANNLTKSKLLHGKTRVILDLDSLFMIYGGQEIDVKRQSMKSRQLRTLKRNFENTHDGERLRVIALSNV